MLLKKKITQTRDLRVGFLFLVGWLVGLGSWGLFIRSGEVWGRTWDFKMWIPKKNPMPCVFITKLCDFFSWQTHPSNFFLIYQALPLKNQSPGLHVHLHKQCVNYTHFILASGYNPQLHEKLCCCSVAKLWSILCDPRDCSTPGSSVLH